MLMWFTVMNLRGRHELDMELRVHVEVIDSHHLSISSISPSTLFSEIFQWTWPYQLAQLSGQRAPRIPLSPSPKCWGYRIVQLCLSSFLHMFWRSPVFMLVQEVLYQKMNLLSSTPSTLLNYKILFKTSLYSPLQHNCLYCHVLS